MKNSFWGYQPRSYRFKDLSHEKTFGAPIVEPILALHTDVSGIPSIFQGSYPGCVSCTASWIKSFLEQNHPALSWEWLALVSGTTSKGVDPGDVFHVAHNAGIAENEDGLNHENHKIGNYFYVKLNQQAIYSALKTSKVLAAGLDSWQGSGPHFVAAFDVSDDGTRLKCVTWDKPGVTSIIEVPFEKVIECISFGEKVEGIEKFRVPFLDILKDKIAMLPLIQKVIGGIVLTIILSFTGLKFGAGGVPGEYATQLAQAITSSDTSIPAISRTLFTGETFDDTSLFHPIAIAVGKGATREYDSCSFFNTTGTFPTFTGCLRGVSALSTSTAITQVSGAAFAHVAGETVTITNQPGFFRNLVDIFTAQSIGGVKTITSGWIFNVFPHTSSTSAVPANNGDFTTKYYVDNTLSTGFSAANVSSTLGLQAITSGVPNCQSASTCVGINASSSAGLAFDPVTGSIGINASSTSSTNGGYLKFSSLGKLYWDVQAFLGSPQTYTNTSTFTGDVVIGGITFNSATVANQAFVNNAVFANSATGTAGNTITAGQALYISSTSTLFATNTSVASSTFQFVGMSTGAFTVGQTVTYTKPGGINCNQSGLLPGFQQYLNGTTGQIASTAGTFFARIGLATSASCVEVFAPKYVIHGKQNITSATTFFQQTGFYPAHIIIYAGQHTGTSNGQLSVGDDSNNTISTVFVSGSTVLRGIENGALAWDVWKQDGAVDGWNQGTVSSKTATGFVLNCTGYQQDAQIQWTAFSE